MPTSTPEAKPLFPTDVKRWKFGEQEATDLHFDNPDLDFECALNVYRRKVFDSSTSRPYRVLLNNVTIRQRGTVGLNMYVRDIPPVELALMPGMFKALCSAGIADENFDTAKASFYVKVTDAAVLHSLFHERIGGDVVTADLELELEHVYYPESVASITMEGPVHLATWKFLRANRQHA
jgi:hypothetical protein